MKSNKKLNHLSMNAFQLKMVAIIAMTIDHIGAVFFPEYLWMRIVGRITMPIMAYLLVEGYYYTSNFKKYILRVGATCLVSILPFGVLFGFQNAGNIMLTLLLGLISIYVLENEPNQLLKSVYLIIFFFLSAFADWSYIGLMMIVGFWQVRNKDVVFGFQNCVLFLALFILGGIALIFSDHVSIFDGIVFGLVSGGGCFFAYPFLKLYHHEQGPKLKYFFYLYYPIHLSVIALWTFLA